jgi:hypothetical protein
MYFGRLMLYLRRCCGFCIRASGEPQSATAEDARGCNRARDEVDETLRLVGIHVTSP